MLHICRYLTIILLFSAKSVLGLSINLEFDYKKLEVIGPHQYIYPETESLRINEIFSLPLKTTIIKANGDINIDDIVLSYRDTIWASEPGHNIFESDDIFTGFLSVPAAMKNIEDNRIRSPLYDIQKFTKDNQYFYSISILPLFFNQDDQLTFCHEISVNIPIDYEISDRTAIYSLLDHPDIPPPEASKLADKTGLPLDCEYVVITSAELAPAFQGLIEYRTLTGISAGVALLDSIYALYEGIDQQAKIKEYLKDFYHAGGQYVLLGGDNIIVPVRYVYYYNALEPPANSYYLQPSDLYYADLDGDWNSDGDGVWGEPTDDSPNLIPEIMVGRIPAANQSSIEQYINKLINYETNPGNGNFDYLTKSLIFSSDQMRDHLAEGQHGEIAKEYPDHIYIDTGRTIETPSGRDINPSNPAGSSAIDIISEGFGLIQVIAHGRIDGFIVRSSDYAEWPISFLLTNSESGEHGSLANLQKNNKSSLYYSLSCNVGGFDLDSANGQPSDISLVEKLIAADSCGAVGMVANSRWGWVYTSYQLQKHFTNRLFTTADGSPVRAMYESWIEYPYYRDLIYGQNFLGDPAMKIFIDQPLDLQAALYRDRSSYLVYISANEIPVSEAIVTISLQGQILESGFSDGNGIYNIHADLDPEMEYTISAVKDNCTKLYDTFMPSIMLDIVDENSGLLPREFELFQNHPNPFNPATTIGFALPRNSDVRLEVYNLLGQQIEKTEYFDLDVGYHEFRWDAGQAGKNYPSGVYFYHISAGEFQQTRKMVLIR